jgi:ATP-dependent helicase Lhr and Lhr-like helicase
MASNDYGFELLSVDEASLDEALEQHLLSPANLAEDITASLNSVELARRQFREIARIAGLVWQGYPGAGKTARQLQASSGLFYDVFAKYDPSNMLLHQAHKEVLEKQLEQTRLAKALQRLSTSRILLAEPPRPTPIAFPLLVDRLRESLSSEAIGARIERMALELVKAAG